MLSNKHLLPTVNKPPGCLQNINSKFGSRLRTARNQKTQGAYPMDWDLHSAKRLVRDIQTKRTTQKIQANKDRVESAVRKQYSKEMFDHALTDVSNNAMCRRRYTPSPQQPELPARRDRPTCRTAGPTRHGSPIYNRRADLLTRIRAQTAIRFYSGLKSTVDNTSTISETIDHYNEMYTLIPLDNSRDTRSGKVKFVEKGVDELKQDCERQNGNPRDNTISTEHKTATLTLSNDDGRSLPVESLPLISTRTVGPANPPTEPAHPPMGPANPPMEPANRLMEPANPLLEPAKPYMESANQPTKSEKPPMEPAKPPMKPAKPHVEPRNPPGRKPQLTISVQSVDKEDQSRRAGLPNKQTDSLLRVNTGYRPISARSNKSAMSSRSSLSSYSCTPRVRTWVDDISVSSLGSRIDDSAARLDSANSRIVPLDTNNVGLSEMVANTGEIDQGDEAEHCDEVIQAPTFICPSSEEKSREYAVRLWLAQCDFSTAIRTVPLT